MMSTKLKRISVSEQYGMKEKKSNAPVEAWVGGDNYIGPAWVTVNDDEAFKLFKANEWLFSVIDRITSDCTQVQPEVVPKDKTAKIEGKLKNRIDAVKAFLDDPNENKESMTEIREKVIRDMLLYGRGAIEKVNYQGRLREIYSMIARNIRVRVDKNGNLYRYRTYQLKSNQTRSGDKYFDKDEVIFMVLTPTSRSLYGIKPVDVVATSVATDMLRCTHNSNYFVNGAEASGILGVPGLSRKEMRKFRQWWESKHKGADNAHRVAVVNSKDVKYVQMALSNRDMEFGEYGKEIRNKILAVYKMQPFIMGIVDGTTGKLNSSEQSRVYKTGALKPILTKESHYYTQEIVRDGFGFDDVLITFSSIDLEDEKTQSEIEGNRLEQGVITINEVRQRHGMPKVPWGDTPVTMLPGGGQIDPDTGKLIPPSGDSSEKQNKSNKELFDEFLVAFRTLFTKNKEKAFDVFSHQVIKNMFESPGLVVLASSFIASVKFISEHSKGDRQDLIDKMDKIIKNIRFNPIYVKEFFDE